MTSSSAAVIPTSWQRSWTRSSGFLSATGATVVLFAGPDSRGGTPVFGRIRGKVAIFNENLREHSGPARRRGGRPLDPAPVGGSAHVGSRPPPLLSAGPPHHRSLGAGSPQRDPHPEAAGTKAHARPASWRDSKAGDLAWFTNYLLPWDGQPRPETLRRPRRGRPSVPSRGRSTDVLRALASCP